MSPRRQRPLRGPSEPLVSLDTRVPHELQRRVRLVCIEQGPTVQEFVAEAIREYLRRQQTR
jgi:hypothetical protein